MALQEAITFKLSFGLLINHQNKKQSNRTTLVYSSTGCKLIIVSLEENIPCFSSTCLISFVIISQTLILAVICDTVLQRLTHKNQTSSIQHNTAFGYPNVTVSIHYANNETTVHKQNKSMLTTMAMFNQIDTNDHQSTSFSNMETYAF